MAVRTTATEVRVLIDTELVDASVDAIISIASLIVDDELSDKGLSASKLKRIEQFLSCHFIQVRDQRNLTSQRILDASEAYSEIRDGFEGTPWGQMALDLDSSGTLKQLSNTKRQATLESI